MILILYIRKMITDFLPFICWKRNRLSYDKFKKIWPKQGLAIRVVRLLILNLYARKVSMHKLLLFMADILEVHTDGMQANSIQTYFALRHHKCKQKPNRKIFWDNFQFFYQTSLKLPKYSKHAWYYQLKITNRIGGGDWYNINWKIL